MGGVGCGGGTGGGNATTPNAFLTVAVSGLGRNSAVAVSGSAVATGGF